MATACGGQEASCQDRDSYREEEGSQSRWHDRLPPAGGTESETMC